MKFATFAALAAAITAQDTIFDTTEIEWKPIFLYGPSTVGKDSFIRTVSNDSTIANPGEEVG